MRLNAVPLGLGLCLLIPQTTSMVITITEPSFPPELPEDISHRLDNVGTPSPLSRSFLLQQASAEHITHHSTENAPSDVLLEGYITLTSIDPLTNEITPPKYLLTNSLGYTNDNSLASSRRELFYFTSTGLLYSTTANTYLKIVGSQRLTEQTREAEEAAVFSLSKERSVLGYVKPGVKKARKWLFSLCYQYGGEQPVGWVMAMVSKKNAAPTVLPDECELVTMRFDILH